MIIVRICVFFTRQFNVFIPFYLFQVLCKTHAISRMPHWWRDALHCALLEHLNSKSTLPRTIPFRHDIFNFLFRQRGAKSNDRGHILLNKRDFDHCHFPCNWDRLVPVDSIGDGVKIDFPVKVRLFLSWGAKNHTLIGNSICPLPCYRPEKIVSFCKAACSLSEKLKKIRIISNFICIFSQYHHFPKNIFLIFRGNNERYRYILNTDFISYYKIQR